MDSSFFDTKFHITGYRVTLFRGRQLRLEWTGEEQEVFHSIWSNLDSAQRVHMCFELHVSLVSRYADDVVFNAVSVVQHELLQNITMTS